MNADNSRRSNPEVFRAILVKHEFTEAELRTHAGDDWPQMEADLRVMLEFAEIVRARLLRERGIAPPYYTSTTECSGCGVVPIWEGCPPHVQACPWCFNRLAGAQIAEPVQEGARGGGADL